MVKCSLFSVLALFNFCIMMKHYSQGSKREFTIMDINNSLLSIDFSPLVTCKNNINFRNTTSYRIIIIKSHLVQNLNGLLIPISAIQNPFFKLEEGSSVLT